MYWNLCAVPPGRVTTYVELARSVGLENGQRAIGRIMNRNPYPGIVPCHRVVKADGSIGGYAYGSTSKERMLRRDGVDVRDGKIVGFEDKLFRF